MIGNALVICFHVQLCHASVRTVQSGCRKAAVAQEVESAVHLNLKVGVSIPASPHADVSSGKMLNPKLPLTVLPTVYETEKVWSIAALYECVRMGECAIFTKNLEGMI